MVKVFAEMFFQLYIGVTAKVTFFQLYLSPTAAEIRKIAAGTITSESVYKLELLRLDGFQRSRNDSTL